MTREEKMFQRILAEFREMVELGDAQWEIEEGNLGSKDFQKLVKRYIAMLTSLTE